MFGSGAPDISALADAGPLLHQAEGCASGIVERHHLSIQNCCFRLHELWQIM